MATWGSIQVGDWVRGKDGHQWAVTERQDHLSANSAFFVLERKGKPRFTGHFGLNEDGPEITNQVDDREVAAIAIVKEVFGGQVLHTEGVAGPGIYAAPPSYPDPGSLMAHMHLLHGYRYRAEGEGIDGMTLSALIAAHDLAHQAKGSGYIEHEHTPDYVQRNQKV